MSESGSSYDRGLMAMKSGDYDTAITELEDASRVNSGDYRTFNCLGAAYAAKGRYEKAIGAFKMAEQIAPQIARIHYNIAQAYEAVGILSEAEYEYEKALAIEPGYERAQAALTALRDRYHQV